MQKWIVKAAVQRAIGLTPGGRRLNRFLQTHVTRSIRLTRARFEDHLRGDQVHLDHYRSMTGNSAPRCVLEIGTGWHPVLPIALWLAGSQSIHTYDIDFQLSDARLAETLKHFADAIRDGTLHRLLPSARADRCRELVEVASAHPISLYPTLARFGITPRVSSCSYADIDRRSIDFIVSNVALEYVPYPDLERMAQEFARVLSPQGAMSHDICMQDEYAYFDSSISKLHFLRFSDRTWKFINNSIIPMSRLRAPDYIRAFRSAGFEMELRDPWMLGVEELQSLRIADRFKRYSADELRILRGHFVCQGVTHAAAGPAPKPTQNPVTFAGALVFGGVDWLEPVLQSLSFTL